MSRAQQRSTSTCRSTSPAGNIGGVAPGVVVYDTILPRNAEAEPVHPPARLAYIMRRCQEAQQRVVGRKPGQQAGEQARPREVRVEHQCAAGRLDHDSCDDFSAELQPLVEAARDGHWLVTAEVTPHHLSLTEDLVTSYDPVYKVAPPLRTKADVEALREALAAGLHWVFWGVFVAGVLTLLLAWQARDLARVATEIGLILLERIDLLDHEDRDHDVVIGERIDRARVVKHHVRVEDVVLGGPMGVFLPAAGTPGPGTRRGGGLHRHGVGHEENLVGRKPRNKQI